MLNLNEEQQEKISIYCDKILEWNEKINLTAIKDREMFRVKHIEDSLSCIQLPEYDNAKRVADLGTGGGFPGIPLAIASPEKDFVLIDSLRKRLKIIDELCEELDIKNVMTVHARAEELGNDKEHREKYDACVSRAVARLNILVEWGLPLVKLNGAMIAFKGLKAEQEADEAKEGIKILGGRLDRIYKYSLESEEMHSRSLVIIKKENNTPKKYPRKPGKAKEAPII